MSLFSDAFQADINTMMLDWDAFVISSTTYYGQLIRQAQENEIGVEGYAIVLRVSSTLIDDATIARGTTITSFTTIDDIALGAHVVRELQREEGGTHLCALEES